ncbi:MAG TPA: TetR/AcrR family transcriptional regulator [Mucilaginibacter sp.]|jgi:TetR/AcrR family transcriptional repressor of nem operon|nr:TetR/AcrR family transcriptional regulator [Mucilaginibacter sp.]
MTERSFIFVPLFRKKMTKAERTKQFIIEKSAPIFNTKGVAGTAMSDIMEATKLAKGSLYVHFDSKNELSYAVVDYNLDKLAEKTIAAMNKHKTAKGKLFAFADLYSDPFNPPMEGGCPMLNFGTEADDTNPIIKQKVDKTLQATPQMLAGIIEQGIIDGEFKNSWSAKEFGIKMFAMIEGGILISRVSGNKEQMYIIINLIKKEIEENSI